MTCVLMPGCFQVVSQSVSQSIRLTLQRHRCSARSWSFRSWIARGSCRAGCAICTREGPASLNSGKRCSNSNFGGKIAFCHAISREIFSRLTSLSNARRFVESPTGQHHPGDDLHARIACADCVHAARQRVPARTMIDFTREYTDRNSQDLDETYQIGGLKQGYSCNHFSFVFCVRNEQIRLCKNVCKSMNASEDPRDFANSSYF